MYNLNDYGVVCALLQAVKDEVKTMAQAFFGGVHPNDMKAATNEKAIEQLSPPPAQVVIPMSMHIGAPAEPVVKKGDTVMVGTVIGKAGGFVSANIYSSVSGTVQDIAPLRMVNGAMTTAVAIKTDGAQTVDPACVPPVVTDKASLLAAVQACGLVGVGGAGFPTHVKLAANTIDTLLINAAECEPYLTTDCRR